MSIRLESNSAMNKNGQVGPYFVNVTSIPYGSNTLFTISNTSYRTRNSYLDIYPNTFYYLIFYLPPIKLNGSTVEENATALYNVRVIETIYTGYSLSDIPVQNAKVTFKRYFNNTLIYSNISTLLTDANGYVNIYLEPSVGYYATIDDTGYNTSTAFFTAFPPDQYGNTLEKTFRVYRQTSTGGIIDYTSMFKNIDFSLEPPGTRHSSGFILYYNISSSDSQLEWYRMNVYYKPDGSSTWTLLFTDNETNPSGGSISYTVANNTGEYSVECWFKKTGYNAIEIYNKGNMAYFIVKLNQWVASIPDDAYFIVMIILMMIGMGFCMLYFGTGVITGYVGLGIMAFMLSLHDITVDTGVGGLGTEIMLNGWVIFGITFLIYTALIFLWSRI